MYDSTGHRKRVKNRFRKEGLDNFEELHVLELLLFYVIPRVDTKPLAQTLIEHFGSLSHVLEANVDELEMVAGVGENTATFLSLISAMSRYYHVNHATKPTILNSVDLCGSFLADYFIGRYNETVYLLCMDAKCKVLCCRKLTEGSVNSANVPVRTAMEIALAAKATTVVLAHNHPSGVALPSKEDIGATHQLAAALSTIDVLLEDHIIVADGDFVSVRQSGLYSPEPYRR